MTKARKSKKSVFYSYAASYIGISFLTFIIVGALILDYYMKDLKESYSEMEKYKVSLVKEELNSQLEITNRVRYKIGSTITYYPIYFNQSVARKMEMMDQLGLYEGSSIFLKEYYLLYPERGEIYSSLGKSNDIVFLLEKIWEIPDCQAVLEQFDKMSHVTMLQAEEGMLWVCLPIPLYYSTQDNKAILLGKIKLDDLLSQVSNKTEFLNDKVAVYFDGKLIAAMPDYQSPSSVEIQEGFQIVYEISETDYLNNLSLFQWMSVSIALAVLLLLVGLCLQAAYYHSRKIRNISTKMGDFLEDVKYGEGNELQNIDEMFQLVSGRIEDYTERLQQQLKIVKRLLFFALITGKYDEKMVGQLQLLNIDLEEKQMAVLRIRETTHTGKNVNISADIEQLSEGPIQYLSEYDEEKKEIAVIMVLRDEGFLTEAVDTVRELLAEEGLDMQIHVGPIYDEINQIANSYLEATRYMDMPKDASGETFIPVVYNSDYVDKIEVAILAGNYEEACNFLCKLVNQMAQVDSLLMQQCICSAVLSMLMRAANKLKVNFRPQQLSDILVIKRIGVFYEKTNEIVQILCESAICEKKIEDNDNMLRVKRYIQQNFLDQDLSIERVADEFGITPAYLSRAFKKSVGKNYKDYIVQMKMDYAKEMLKQGKSVAEVNEIIGYSKVSHFIRAFRQQTGVTPAVFRENEKVQ